MIILLVVSCSPTTTFTDWCLPLLQETFSRRLRAFYDSTSPLLSYFASPEARVSAKMITLTGASSDEIWPKLDAIVTSEFRLKPRAALVKGSVQEAIFRAEGQGPLYASVASKL